MMLGSVIPDVVSSQMAIEGFKQIDMPAYLLPFLGIAKIAGVMAILILGYPRIKEWAHARLVLICQAQHMRLLHPVCLLQIMHL